MSMLDNLDEAEDAEICKHIIEKTEYTKQLAAGFDPGDIVTFEDAVRYRRIVEREQLSVSETE